MAAGKTVRGVATVEMAYIMPVVLLVFVMLVYTTFYFHDKNILLGETAEAAVVGAQKERMLSGLDGGAVGNYFTDRARRKMILLTQLQISISTDGDDVIATASASHGRMKVAVKRKQSKMNAETYIRLLRKTGVKK